MHPNEERLRRLYATFAQGDLQGFLDGCTDDVSFHVPGNTPGSGVFDKSSFFTWIGAVMETAAGTFQEHVLDVFANDDHGLLELRHELDRAGAHRVYLTAHAVELRDGLISRWEERPGSMAEFESAWGVVGGADGETVVRRIFEEVVNQGRLDVADELFAPDYVDHGPMGDVAGIEGFKGLLAQWISSVSDLHCSVDNVVVRGDLVGWTVRSRGVHTGDGLGFPATGKSFDTVSANVGRLRDGKAVEHWSEQGMLPMLMQLGVLPPMGAAVGAA
ncbi:MAG TPA: nuclear transport factor 2 family protein [Acidimicrobiales bacterium]|nr:nuclear transport factor 2 family protein [Acidimicrobiales bacterium]